MQKGGEERVGKAERDRKAGNKQKGRNSAVCALKYLAGTQKDRRLGYAKRDHELQSQAMQVLRAC